MAEASNQHAPEIFQCIGIGDTARWMILNTFTGEWKVYTSQYDRAKCLSEGRFEDDEPTADKSMR